MSEIFQPGAAFVANLNDELSVTQPLLPPEECVFDARGVSARTMAVVAGAVAHAVPLALEIDEFASDAACLCLIRSYDAQISIWSLFEFVRQECRPSLLALEVSGGVLAFGKLALASMGEGQSRSAIAAAACMYTDGLMAAGKEWYDEIETAARQAVAEMHFMGKWEWALVS